MYINVKGWGHVRKLVAERNANRAKRNELSSYEQESEARSWTSVEKWKISGASFQFFESRIRKKIDSKAS